MAPRGAQREQFNPQVAFEDINSCNALSEAGSDGLRFSHLQSIIRTQFGQEHFGAGIEAFWRRMVDEPNAFRRSFVSSSCIQTSRPWGENAARFVCG